MRRVDADRLIEIIQRQVTDGWISVNDRLPEVDRPVLVYAIGKLDCFIGKSQMVITSMSDRSLIDYNVKIDPYWISPWLYFMTDYEITHWRYLPEPPEPELIRCAQCKYMQHVDAPEEIYKCGLHGCECWLAFYCEDGERKDDQDRHADA